MAPTRTHILYVAEFSTGGSIESLLTLIGGLDKLSFNATVLFYTMPDPAVCARIESAGASAVALYPHTSEKVAPGQLRKYNLQAKVRKIFGRRIERFYESLKFALYFVRFRRSIYRALRDKISEIHPDLVHLNTGVATDTPGTWAARTCRIPAICHVRDFDRLTYLSVAAARSVSVFVCISFAVRKHLINFGIDPDRCIVVPNAVDLTRFNDSELPAVDIRTEFGWSSAHKVFVLAGRVVSWKGQDYFIEAIAEARKTDVSIRGLIVGEGEASQGNQTYVARLHSLVSELGLDEVVKFTGHRTDVQDIMKAADVVVCASSSPEPFGRVIIESMAVGTPVVATNAGGAPDIITDGENGILVSMKDSDALAKAMLRLSKDENFAQGLRSAALLTVTDRYTVRRHADQISDIYRSVLGLQQP